MDKYFYLVILALLSSLLLYVFIPDSQDAGTFASYEGIALSDISGQQFKLTGQFTEKPILFVFWSIWLLAPERLFDGLQETRHLKKM